MRNKLKIPLLFKLVLLIGFLLVTSSLFIANQNSELFSDFSFEREEEHNLSLAQALSQGLDSSLNGLIDKSKSFGVEAVQAIKKRNINDLKILTQKLKQNPSIHFINIFSRKNSDIDSIQRISNPILTKDIKKKLFAIDWDSYKDIVIQSLQGETVFKKFSNSNDDPYVIMSIPIVKSGDLFSHYALVLVHSQYFLKFLGKYKQYEIFVTDSEGSPFASSQEGFLKNRFSQSKEVVLNSIEKKIDVMRKRYNSPNGKEYILSLAKTPHGVYIFSNLSAEIIKRPALYITKQGQFTLGIVISVAFFFIFLFSSSITSPIEKLEGLLKEVSKGNFDVSASNQIKSRDEVGALAKSFDEMTEGLREREKMNNLFDKLHGSAIKDELLNSDAMKPKGTKRNVVIFFSDIRGFTDFSEHHTAEEVVEMLNSYFEVMVRIINESGGVVDKFIGDAIVAVWGVPEEAPDDTHRAVRACLEMRRALVDYNDQRIAKGELPIKIGIGLNTGRVISGTIGSTERMEYTVIGDAVNTASRIEGATKGFGSDFLISQACVDKIKDSFVITEAGKVKAKGKNEPLTLYKVPGYIDEEGKEQIIRTIYSDFEAEEDAGEKTQKIQNPLAS